MSKPPAKGSGHRGLFQKVRNARRRTASSQRWLERQLNDPYVARAKEAGYRSRAAFKLIEIDDKHRLLIPGRRVIDLGAAPGGWSQVAAQRVGSTAEKPLVVAIDYLSMDPIEGVSFVNENVETKGVAEQLIAELGGAPHTVLSDMAAPTTGHRQTDHLRTQHLAETAAAFAIDVLAKDGNLIVKTFRGGAGSDLLAELKRHFNKVVHIKPEASRSSSVELYLLAKGRRASEDS